MSLSDRDRDLQARMDAKAAETRAWGLANQAAGGVCDFCCHLLADAGVTFVTSVPFVETISALSVDDLSAGSITIAYDPRWLACPDCVPVVEAGDPERLADHALAHRDVERVGPIRDLAEARADLVGLYQTFFSLHPERE